MKLKIILTTVLLMFIVSCNKQVNKQIKEKEIADTVRELSNYEREQIIEKEMENIKHINDSTLECDGVRYIFHNK